MYRHIIFLALSFLFVGCDNTSSQIDTDKSLSAPSDNLRQDTKETVTEKNADFSLDINSQSDTGITPDTSSQDPIVPDLLNTEMTTGVLLGYPTQGVSYRCDEIEGSTTWEGRFACPKASKVSFFVGGIALGSYLPQSDTNISFVLPTNLYGLANNNISDQRVLNFIQLLLSLDEDADADNGIQITIESREMLIASDLNISDTDTNEEDIQDTLTSIGKQLIPQSSALVYYIDILQNELHITLDPEPYAYQQWYLDKNESIYELESIDSDAHIHTNGLLQKYTGREVKIAIIDDGLDVTHEDLQGAIIHSYDITTHASNVAHTYLSDYHGTAVTGIIGARVNAKGIKGIASSAQIIFLKYKENMSDSETIELFEKAEFLGADIINCSWGTYDVSQAVKEKIQDLARNGRDGKGTIIVFAAGNNNAEMGNDESAIPEVIAVGATDKENLRAWYGNYGENLDIVAPGGYDIGITTLDAMGENGIADNDENYLLYDDYNSFIGTSAAAPIVTSVIALMLEKNPHLTRAEIEESLKYHSDKIGNLEYLDGFNRYYGYGKINVSRALRD